MAACGTQVTRFRHQRTSCGAMVYVPIRCRVRSCRHCGRARCARELARYKGAIQGFRMPAILTFTVPNVKTAEELPGAVENLTKNFERLRRHRIWPKAARGLWSLEITWSEAKGFHPHLHVLADFPWVSDYERELLAAAWSELTGARHQVDIKRARTPEQREGLAHEGIKYVMKAWELDPAALRAILAVIGRRKMLNAFGGLRAGAKRDSEALCPGCSAPLRWAFKNFAKLNQTAAEAELDGRRMKAEGYQVFTDWIYPEDELSESPGARDCPPGPGNYSLDPPPAGG
ncbi:MAG TPA: protein rep [Candidatus Dormibacteraeota bacterium]|nr:protein rep [Candidatus Dormibacteraeota bacterium]